MNDRILVTGGAGFIGSNFILQWMEQEMDPLVNLDKLTYAGNPKNLESVLANPRYHFVHADICDRETVRSLLLEQRPLDRVSAGQRLRGQRRGQRPQTRGAAPHGQQQARGLGGVGGFRFDHVSFRSVPCAPR